MCALQAPAVPLKRSPTAAIDARQTLREAEHEPDDEAEAYWITLEDMATLAVSPLDRVESSLHPWTSRIVVPTFALANAGIELNSAALSEAGTSSHGLGVLLGLVVGKPLGICGAVWVATRARIGRLQDELTFRMLLGVAVLAGVGFTVALFVAELAFGTPRDVETAKLAVLLASLFASVLGAIILRSAKQTDTQETVANPERMASGHADRRFT